MTLYVIFAISICGLLYYMYSNIDKNVKVRHLKGKHVVITGGSSGIGKASALEAVKLGASVTIIGRDVEKLQKTVDEMIPFRYDVNKQIIKYLALDVTSDYKTIENCFESLDNESPIFMLINCAGSCTCGTFDEMNPDDIKQMVDLNYLGSAFPTRAVLPKMKRRKNGIIVFVASEAALFGIYGYTAYAGGKWGVRGLAEALSMELIGTGVRTMLAFPPDTDTPGYHRENESKPELTRWISSAGGLQRPEYVAKRLLCDALYGRLYCTSNVTGYLLVSIFGGLIEEPIQVVCNIMLHAPIKICYVFALMTFHRMVRKFHQGAERLVAAQAAQAQLHKN